MLTHHYTYQTCLDGSVRNAWTVEDCFQGRDFDYRWTFLVSGLEHPNFVRIVKQLSPTSGEQLAKTASALSA